MNIDLSLLGKIYVQSKDRIFIVAGYDFSENRYLLRSVSNTTYYYGNYSNLTNTIQEKLKDSEDVIKEIDEEISRYKNVLAVYDKFFQNCSSENEARNTIRRLKETKKQIRLLRKYAEDKNIVYSAPYKRELQKAEKGLRRIYKILHSRTSEEDYNAIINYAAYTIDYLNREDLFKLPNQIEPEIKRLEKTKNEILTFKEKLALE